MASCLCIVCDSLVTYTELSRIQLADRLSFTSGFCVLLISAAQVSDFVPGTKSLGLLYYTVYLT